MDRRGIQIDSAAFLIEMHAHIRKSLRRFFEVDAESTVIATLYALAQKGHIEKSVVAQAIKDLGVNPEKVFPQLA